MVENDGLLDYCYHGGGYLEREIDGETCLIRDYGVRGEVNPNHWGLYVNAAYGDGHVEGKFKADNGDIHITAERAYRIPTGASILVMPGT
jgi:prepilin-type processing-associated H-X9-DG protein